jgi:hypothetical protein
VTRLPEPPRTDDLPAPGDAEWETWLESRTVSSEGVDIALIREHLARTPTERLAILERTVNDLLELRGGRWPEVP